MRRHLIALCSILAACGGTTPEAEEPTPGQAESPPVAEAPRPPVAEVRPVTATYHGEAVVDPYQWLENPDDAEVRAWSDGQNAYARHVLDGLAHRDAIRARVTEILSAPTRSHRDLRFAGGKLFAIERRPPREQPFLVVMDSFDAPDDARVLVDPTTIDEEGHVAIDWYLPSHDGALVAVSLSRGGSESGDVHVYDVATGQQVHEVIEHVNGGTAGGDVAWMPDNSGLFYTRYPRAGDEHADDANFFQQLWYHQLGTEASEDRYEIGRDFPRIAEIQLEMHPTTGRLLATVQNGDGGEFAMHLRERDGRWRTFSTFEDGHVQVTFGPRDDVYVVSRHEHPRGRILRVPIRQLDIARGTEVIAEGEASIVTDFWDSPTVYPTADRLYVTYQLGGPSELRVFDLRGRPQGTVDAPDVSAIRAIAPLDGGSFLFRVESFVTPAAWMHVDGRTHETRATALRETSPVDVSGWEVRREMATSRDGTQVPLNILMPRGIELDGSHPTIVNGYGGYGVNIEPRFSPARALYLDNGVVYVIANLRGGAEFGEEWHEQGSLTHKQNVFDDFAAGIQHMIDRRYTTSARLGIIGGSNGGLLMGATLVQHPELVHVVVSFVGIYDMLRVELSPNGAFNVTEFGSVEDEAQYRALRAYSPYHNVADGTSYPATLFLTGANDPRVEPWHSRKMTARLQAAQAGDAPILLRTSDTSGHGLDTALSEEIAEMTDVTSFLFAELGVRPSAR
ncbi:MAG: prolyl oligopeptidase family serine peptidase [Myxococcales bacterium]|nr:prolyl oligopeptidase family serine peptidase [Myxococcales bacterium]